MALLRPGLRASRKHRPPKARMQLLVRVAWQGVPQRPKAGQEARPAASAAASARLAGPARKPRHGSSARPRPWPWPWVGARGLGLCQGHERLGHSL